MIEMKENEKTGIKESYEKRISTLENQLKDEKLKIKNLTEEKVQIYLYTSVFHSCDNKIEKNLFFLNHEN